MREADHIVSPSNGVMGAGIHPIPVVEAFNLAGPTNAVRSLLYLLPESRGILALSHFTHAVS
jgi:hypothetical protein